MFLFSLFIYLFSRSALTMFFFSFGGGGGERKVEW